MCFKKSKRMVNREQITKVPREIVREENDAASVKHRNGQRRFKRRVGERNKRARGGSEGRGGREERGWRDAELSAHRGNEKAGEQEAAPTQKEVRKNRQKDARQVNRKKGWKRRVATEKR